MDDEEARTIGRRVRQVRNARQKSQRVVAERAGISKSYLCRLEKGQRALNQRSLIVALADALEIAWDPGRGAGHRTTSLQARPGGP